MCQCQGKWIRVDRPIAASCSKPKSSRSNVSAAMRRLGSTKAPSTCAAARSFARHFSACSSLEQSKSMGPLASAELTLLLLFFPSCLATTSFSCPVAGIAAEIQAWNSSQTAVSIDRSVFVSCAQVLIVFTSAIRKEFAPAKTCTT